MLLFVPFFSAGGGGGASPETPVEAEDLQGNRLVHEKSPYLQQHAHNPVDWYPWGEEAIQKARRESKPIFLSIGYSTCHWCHVMERESFEDEEIAALLNERFVPIKVDREERPDLDHIYMTAVQAMTGQGGWPLSVFLTPDLEPFYGGTYSPPDDRLGRPGFKSLLERIAHAWSSRRGGVDATARKVASFLKEQGEPAGAESGSTRLYGRVLEGAFKSLRQRYDADQGGFGGAPKFPTPHVIGFLLRYAHRTGNAEALEMVRHTLDAMAAGGIHDHLGGGFHRYATDAAWLVPHFEKMLYDQAGLALAYTDAYLVTGDATYAGVVRGILDYVLAYLTHPGGGFFAAEDADSEGEEGTFYVWESDQIDDVLGHHLGHTFRRNFGVSPQGNWEGKNILHRSLPIPPLSDELREARDRLLKARDQRPRPHRDEKIIVAWNGLMIEALARAGRALAEPRYTAAAQSAARFVEENLWREGRLLRHYRDGAADAAGFLDDYAFLGMGLLALYETTFHPHHLGASVHLARELVRLFAREDGAFNYAGKDGEQLLAPVLDIHDGALPSGNAAAATFLLRLGYLTGDSELISKGRDTVRTFYTRIERSPGSHTAMLAALDFALGPVTEVVLAGRLDDPELTLLRKSVARSFRPNTVLLFNPDIGDQSPRPADREIAAYRDTLYSLVPYLEAQKAIGGRATAYVCRDYACRAPVHDTRALGRMLDGGGR